MAGAPAMQREYEWGKQGGGSRQTFVSNPQLNSAAEGWLTVDHEERINDGHGGGQRVCGGKLQETHTGAISCYATDWNRVPQRAPWLPNNGRLAQVPSSGSPWALLATHSRPAGTSALCAHRSPQRTE